MRRFTSHALCVSAGLAAAAGVEAQAIDRIALRDSVAAVTDIDVLRRIAAGPPVSATADPIAQGLARLRLWTLTAEKSAAARARDAFEDASRRDPRDAWAWYGIGRTWAEGPEATGPIPAIVLVEAFEAALGLDARSRAIRAFTRALDIDTAFTPAAVALVPLAVEKRDRGALAKAQATLALAEREGRFETGALLALARARAALDDGSGAVDAARRAVTNASAEAAPLARWILARSLFLAGRDDEGERVWFSAVDALDPETAALAWQELGPIAGEWESERWDGADTEGRKAWLHRFWDERAALGGVSVARRIADHYRRLDAATERYPRRRKWGARPFNAMLLERPDLPFDDRGIIYVRHGEPIDIITSPGADRQRNESWVYPSPEGGFVSIHFIEYDNEYVIAWTLPCGEWAWDRAHYDRRMGLLRCNEFDQRAISAEVRRDARIALRTDSDRPLFARDLDFAFDVYTFRGDNGLTDVTAALIVPGTQIAPEPAFDGVAYGIDVSLGIVDTLFGRVTRADTSLTVRTPSPLTADDWLRAHLTLHVTPATAAAQRIVLRERADSAHGRLLGRTLDVPDYSGDRLMLSDIVMAEPERDGTFRRGDVALRLVPAREFPGGAFRIFYEVYNLDRATYSTEITVERVRSGIGGALRSLLGGGTPVRLRFDGIAAARAGVLQEIRRVDTDLDPGDYRIRVRVRDGEGRTAERTRPFTVTR